MTSPLAIFSGEVKRRFRQLTEANMPHSARVQYATTVNVGGRMTTTWADRFTSMCRMSSVGPAEKERLMAGAVGAPSFVAVFFPAGTVVERTDRLIIVGATQTDEGTVSWARAFAVVAVDAPDVAVEVQRRVIAQELVSP